MAQERENLKTDEENRLVTRGVLDENYVFTIKHLLKLDRRFFRKKEKSMNMSSVIIRLAMVSSAKSVAMAIVLYLTYTYLTSNSLTFISSIVKFGAFSILGLSLMQLIIRILVTIELNKGVIRFRVRGLRGWYYPTGDKCSNITFYKMLGFILFTAGSLSILYQLVLSTVVSGWGSKFGVVIAFVFFWSLGISGIVRDKPFRERSILRKHRIGIFAGTASLLDRNMLYLNERNTSRTAVGVKTDLGW